MDPKANTCNAQHALQSKKIYRNDRLAKDSKEYGGEAGIPIKRHHKALNDG